MKPPIAFATLLLALALPTAPASAASKGTVTFQLGTNGAAALGDAGVRLGASGSARAKGKRVAVRFPLAQVKAGKSPLVTARGGLRLRRGKRTVILRDVRVGVRAGRVSLAADAAGKRLTILSGRVKGGALDRDRAGVHLSGTAVALTASARSRLGRLLRAGLPRRALGTIRIAAAPAAGPTAPKAPAAPPVPLPRPATATAVTAATLRWNVRDSFIRYINTGEGTSVSGGATADPAEVHPGSDTALVYSFRFPFGSGWYDPSNGTASIGFAGAVRFRYSAHTIDFTTSAPAIEMGPASRAIAGYEGPTAGPLAGQRAVLVDLDPAAAARTVSPDGKTITYTTIPAKVPAGSAGVFGGFYAPGDPFGSMTVSFTIP